MSSDPTDTTLLDLAHLNRLAAKPTGCRELIEAFITATEPLLDELEQALEQRDEPAFHQFCHALTGAAMSTGAKAIAKTCQALTPIRDPTEQAATVEKLKNEFRQTREAFLALLATLPSETPTSAGPSTTKTILVVEDNVATRLALEAELSDRYRLLTTENSTAALALCEGEPVPNAAIVDLNLGFSDGNQRSGLDVIRHLKEKVPTLVLTVDSSPEAAEAALRAGAWVFLSKSVPFALLRANLETMMARFEEANSQASNHHLDIVMGLLMAHHHLAYPDAQRLLKLTAAMQRRRIPDIVEDILHAHALHSNLCQTAHRLPQPSDPPPS